MTQLLTGLADQHVALSEPKAGKTETLGVLFRTSSDGQMVVWRILDPTVTSLSIGDKVLAINDVTTPEWQRRLPLAEIKGIPVGDSGYNALVSEDFYVFDPTSELQPGEINEQRLIDRVAAERFAPSHLRPYMTQAMGVRPDIVQLIEASDLEDGGQRLVERSIAGMRSAL
ncbi:hypothetical protein I4699_02040 [Xanthomonas hortorum pv. carotae]|nr:hypothetical protein XHC_2404 [Xanthomonas hortorum pv. carotae str. M081]MBG3849106.1 hypothetical protein [Xanthomonas hortorum pv. carotae]